jgi:hypothetical protein
MKFKLNDLRDLNEVECKLVDKSRWESIYEAVYLIDEKFYLGSYSKGSTEYQETDWNQEVELVEVREVEKIVKVWEVVSDNNNLS